MTTTEPGSLHIGTIAPTVDGDWRVAVGLGIYCREIGRRPTAEAARAALADRGVTRIVQARPGELGQHALAREDRERIAADTGIRVDWLHAGATVRVVRVDDEMARILPWHEPGQYGLASEYHAARDRLAEAGLLTEVRAAGTWAWRRTWLGELVTSALRAGHMRHTVLVCGAWWHERDDHDHVPCTGCRSQLYLGDLQS